MNVRLLCAVIVILSMLSHARGNGVCYMAVVETSTISVSVVVSSTQYYSCGFLGWSTCSRIEYSTQQVYTTISQSRSQFACCDRYLQIGTSESCKANITSGPAIPQLSTVIVNTTGNPNSLHAIWSLTNNSNGSSPSFNASCTAQDGSHHVDYSVGQTYNATFVGLRPSTSYTCCVWAVVAGNAGSATCSVLTQTQGLCDGFSNTSSCLNGTTCLKYYYNTTVMNCLCQMCPIEYIANDTATTVDDYFWVAALVTTLITVILVIVIVVAVSIVILRYRKAHSIKVKMDQNVSYGLQNLNIAAAETSIDHAVSARLELENTNPTAQHTLEQFTKEVKNSMHQTVLATRSQGIVDHKTTTVINPAYGSINDASGLIQEAGFGVAANESSFSKLDHTPEIAGHTAKDHTHGSCDNYDYVAHLTAAHHLDGALHRIVKDLKVNGYSGSNTNTSEYYY